MIRPVAVSALDGYRLRLRYADGVEGVIDLSKLVGKGVFASLAEPAMFQKVRIGDSGQIAWSEEMEICPDSAYLEITGRVPQAAGHA